jgi:hypothetical protein
MDHTADSHVPHSHGHTHNHHHDHSHGESDYYLQQLLTVFICGAFGVSGVLMYTLDKLPFILAPAFHIWVLVGSLLLLAAVLVRGYSLWQTAGERAIHSHTHDHHHHHHHHDHKHDEECGHEHKLGEKCDHHLGHSHDHSDHSVEDHSHGNVYWRVVVLAFPVVILLMGLPNRSFSTERTLKILGTVQEVQIAENVEAKEGFTSDFDHLASIAYDPQKREGYTGQKATIKGKVRPVSVREFQLYKLKITCCSADAIPLQARIVLNTKSDSEARAAAGKFATDGEYEVTGRIQFAQEKSGGDFITVLVIDPKDPDSIRLVK